MSLKYLSVCSGMEAASVAWEHMGWEPVGFCEIEPFPSAILKHRFPNTPNYGDLTKFKEWPIEPGTVDVLVGGTPCQAFSVAGLRKGLEDPRGNLALTFLALADKIKPKWILWENVPGVLTSSGGRDFYSFLSALGELGYGFSWRTLDAQHFGVPQRRRRVFVVAHFGAWEPCAEVLSLIEGMQRYSEESSKKGKGTAARAKSRPRSDSSEDALFQSGGDGKRHGGLNPEIAPTVCAVWEKGADAGKAGSMPNFIGEYWNGKETTSTLTTRSVEQRMPDKDQFMGVIVPQEGSGSPTALPFQEEQKS